MANSSNNDFLSVYAKHSAGLVSDPSNPFWLAAPPITAHCDSFGRTVAGVDTAVRSRWTESSLFVLFESVYQSLYLKPSPTRDRKTWELWNWDVVELFIGDDWENIENYREFELSPQGEWLDLAIDRTPPDLERNLDWTSGFETLAHIDTNQSVWYGAMRIPFTTISKTAIEAGKRFRANFYRMEGAPGERKLIAWRETRSHSFHVPAAFGNLVLTL